MTGAKKSTAVTIGLLVILFFVDTGYAQKRPCADAEARAALDEAVTLRSWDALYGSYKSHRQCDDGAIAEGYAESLARILVDHWNTLPRLADLAKKDAEFRAFVMEHVDATLDHDDVEKIKNSARTQCPTGLRVICNDLEKRADSALRNASSP